MENDELSKLKATCTPVRTSLLTTRHGLIRPREAETPAGFTGDQLCSEPWKALAHCLARP